MGRSSLTFALSKCSYATLPVCVVVRHGGVLEDGLAVAVDGLLEVARGEVLVAQVLQLLVAQVATGGPAHRLEGIKIRVTYGPQKVLRKFLYLIKTTVGKIS